MAESAVQYVVLIADEHDSSFFHSVRTLGSYRLIAPSWEFSRWLDYDGYRSS